MPSRKSAQAGRQPADSRRPVIDPRRIRAVLADLDGVITRTAALHAAAWKEVFDAFLARQAPAGEHAPRPFDAQRDYYAYVDGKPRYDGVAAFLAARGIRLPRGTPEDPPTAETVCGIGNRKNEHYLRLLQDRGVEVFDRSVAFLHRARDAGLAIAAVTSSRNGRLVLQRAHLEGLFDLVLDGVDLAEAGLPGKPAPDMYLEAARRLGVEPRQAMLVEDAVSGIQAGRRGGFALVVGLDHGRNKGLLRQAGADLVVGDLERFAFARPGVGPDRPETVAALLSGRNPALFLDYDGTLTPIVDRPEQAVLTDSVREALVRVARRMPVAVVSGRAREEVARMVGLDALYYAGSHGFEISGPDGFHQAYPPGEQYVPAMHDAARRLRQRLAGVEGALVEDKTYAVAVHYRLVSQADLARVRQAVTEILAAHPDLRRTGGKKVYELRPRLDWDKGHALEWLMRAMHLDAGRVLPVYVGDDETDEDAFAALADRGIGILVAARPRATAARYRLADPGAVAVLLDCLAAGTDPAS
ncbi:MAG TPA: trehalose-phosphatase [Gammaproteobacteria bacterium]|nr:trehalose-phosphatase [Gammaproteobacteria bacterium]